MKKIILSATLATVVLASGCASIISDSSYQVSLQSAPAYAEFTVTDKNGVAIHSGRTPATINLKSGSGYFSAATYTVNITKDGYEPQMFTLKGSMDGWYWGNILFGGLLGMLIIDPVTGAMWKLPETHSTSLYETLASTDAEEKLSIVSIQDVPISDRDKLIRIN